MSRVHILGVPVDSLMSDQVIDRLHALLAGRHCSHVMTPNSEMVVEATRNPAFMHVLRHTALNIADSQGLVLAARLTGQHLPQRVTGVDTVTRLCLSLGPDVPVFFLGARKGVAEKAAQALRKQHPSLNIVGTFSGSPRPEDADDILRRIQHAKPKLLLVAYGAPKQDLWISEHMHQLTGVRVAMGVGGTFDFLAGVSKRAPKIVQSIGLEWLWRLVWEPWRYPRIFTAVVVFPWLVFRASRRATVR